MKKSILSSFLLICSISLFAQSPEFINYQGVLRDANGNVLPNITLKTSSTIEIDAGGTTYTNPFPSVPPVVTNAYGLFSARISLNSNNANIDWNNTGVKIRSTIEYDDANGIAQSIQGSWEELSSVPYSLYANEVKNYPKTGQDGEYLKWDASANNGNGSWISSAVSSGNTLPNSATIGQVLTWNGVEWVAQDNDGYEANTDNQNLSNVLTQGNSAGSIKITDLSDPTNAQDASTKLYVDNLSVNGSSDYCDIYEFKTDDINGWTQFPNTAGHNVSILNSSSLSCGVYSGSKSISINGVADLISPNFDLSGSSCEKVTISFYERAENMSCNNFSYNCPNPNITAQDKKLTVYYSTNNGSSWIQLHQKNAPGNSSQCFQSDFLQITKDIVISNQAQIKFKISQTGTSTGNQWFLDDITISSSLNGQTTNGSGPIDYRSLWYSNNGVITSKNESDVEISGGFKLTSGSPSLGKFLQSSDANGTASWASVPSYSLPIASLTTLGGVKVGSGLSINSSGVLSNSYSYSLPTASSTTLGGVKVGSGLSINSSGVLSANVTSTDNLGDHTASQNIQLNDKWLSNDGNNEGIRIDNSGKVGIGTTSPAVELDVNGKSRIGWHGHDDFISIAPGELKGVSNNSKWEFSNESSNNPSGSWSDGGQIRFYDGSDAYLSVFIPLGYKMTGYYFYFGNRPDDIKVRTSGVSSYGTTLEHTKSFSSSESGSSGTADVSFSSSQEISASVNNYVVIHFVNDSGRAFNLKGGRLKIEKCTTGCGM